MAFDNEKTILIVDDDKAYVDNVGAALEKKGYAVMVAHDGNEALKAIDETRPDLILLDIIMPKMSGLAFYDRITPPNSRPAYPIIVITVRENLKELFSNLPVEGFFTKPVDVDALIAKVAAFFDKQKDEALKKKKKAKKAAAKDVLILDNDFETARNIAGPFLERGYTVTTLMNVEDAIERIIGRKMPDLIVIRQGLPEKPEFTISYHLRGMAEGRKATLVIYTLDYKTVDMLTETEIVNIVGEKNFLEMNDAEYFLKRCEWLQENKP